MADPKPTDALLEMEKTLKGMEESIGKKVAELEASGKTASETITAYKAELEDVKKSIKEVAEQLKERNLSSLPGVDIGKEKFSLQMYIRGIYNERNKISNPWGASGLEKKAIDEIMARRTSQQSDDPEYGGYLIPSEVSSEIMDMAVAQMPLLGMGVTILKGLHGELSFPYVSSRSTGYWVGEEGKPTLSNVKFGRVKLARKKCGAFTKITKDLVYQTRGVADAFIKEALATDLAIKQHDGLINGTGGDNQPKGIFNWSGTTAITEETNGLRLGFDGMAKMIQKLEEANYLQDGGSYAFLTSPTVKWGLRRQTVLYATGGDNIPLFANSFKPFLSDADIEAMLGYPVKTTTQVSKTLTKGSSTTCSAAMFGNWKKVIVGQWRDFVMNVSDVASDGSNGSAMLEDQFYVVCFNSIDLAMPRPEAFVVRKDAETSAIV